MGPRQRAVVLALAAALAALSLLVQTALPALCGRGPTLSGASEVLMPVRHRQLTANAVMTVTLTQAYDEFEIINVDGAAAVYFRLDGVDPTIAGDDCEVLPATIGGQVLTTYADYTRDSAVVKLISTGAPRVAVRAW